MGIANVVEFVVWTLSTAALYIIGLMLLFAHKRIVGWVFILLGYLSLNAGSIVSVFSSDNHALLKLVLSAVVVLVITFCHLIVCRAATRDSIMHERRKNPR